MGDEDGSRCQVVGRAVACFVVRVAHLDERRGLRGTTNES